MRIQSSLESQEFILLYSDMQKHYEIFLIKLLMIMSIEFFVCDLLKERIRLQEVIPIKIILLNDSCSILIDLRKYKNMIMQITTKQGTIINVSWLMFRNQNIQMEKNKNSFVGKKAKITNGELKYLEQRNYEGFFSRPLGGICLYNQNYRRHVEKKSSIQDLNHLCHINEQNKNLKKDFDVQSQYQAVEQKSIFLDQDKISQIKNNHQLTAEIQRVIDDLKQSQSLTLKLVDQIKKNKREEDYSIMPFQQLFQFDIFKNNTSFIKVFHKFQLQFNRKINEELEKIIEMSKKQVTRNKQQNYNNVTTQTLPDSLFEEVKMIRKQLQMKKIEYDVLCKHFDQNTIDNDKRLQQKLLQQYKKHQNKIKILQQNVKQKTEQSKKLKNQLKNVQNILLQKVIELQKHQNALGQGSQLQSIKEDQFRQNYGVAAKKSELARKTHSKQKQIINRRGGSVLFTPKALFDKVNKNVISSSKIIEQSSSLQKQQQYLDLESLVLEANQLSSKMRQSGFNHMKNYKNSENKSTKSLAKDRFYKTQNSKKSLGNSKSKLFESLQSDLQNSKTNQSNLLFNNFAKKSKCSSENDSFLRVSLQSTLKCNERLSIQTHQQFNNQEKNQRISVYQKSNYSKNYPFSMNKQKNKMKKVKKQVFFHTFKAESGLTMCKQVMNIKVNNLVHLISLNKKSKPFIKKMQTVSRNSHEKNKLAKGKKKKATYFQLKSQQNEKIKKEQMSTVFINDEHQQDYSKNTLTLIDGLCRFSSHHSKQSSSPSPQKCILNSVDELNIKVKYLIEQCSTKQQFKQQFKKLHKNCQQNCSHWMKYIQNFYKIKKILRPTIKLSCQDINTHIR